MIWKINVISKNFKSDVENVSRPSKTPLIYINWIDHWVNEKFIF